MFKLVGKVVSTLSLQAPFSLLVPWGTWTTVVQVVATTKVWHARQGYQLLVVSVAVAVAVAVVVVVQLMRFASLEVTTVVASLVYLAPMSALSVHCQPAHLPQNRCPPPLM